MTFIRLFAAALIALAPLPALASATTTNLGLNKPSVGADSDAWGALLNTNADLVDAEFAVTALGDASLTATSASRVIRLTTAFSAPRTITLPPATSLTASKPIVIVDVAGAISPTNTLTLARAGSDTINGAASRTVSAANSVVVLRSDGTSK